MRQSLLNEATMNRSGYRIAALCALLVGVAGISGATAQPKSCPTCNCQINNIELLDQLVEAKIKHLLADEPRKLLCLSAHKINILKEKGSIIMLLCYSAKMFTVTVRL